MPLRTLKREIRFLCWKYTPLHKKGKKENIKEYDTKDDTGEEILATTSCCILGSMKRDCEAVSIARVTDASEVIRSKDNGGKEHRLERVVGRVSVCSRLLASSRASLFCEGLRSW